MSDDDLRLEHAEPNRIIYPDLCRYEVWLNGVIIGTVESQRSESWRSMSNGVRYGRRGAPKHWEAVASRDWQPNGNVYDFRIGRHFDTRKRAVAALVERFREQ